MSELDPAVAARVVARTLELDADGSILVTGSHARGTATRDSDLDVVLLTERAQQADYVTWFEERPETDRPLHVSLGIRSPAEWRARASRPEPWALGFPARFEARWLVPSPAALAELGDDPSQDHPAGPPELEDVVEALVKTRRALGSDDAVAAGWHARDAGELMPRLLLGLNEPRVVRDRLDALHAALGLAVAPDGWQDGLLTALGLTASSPEAAARETIDLGRRLLVFLRFRAPHVDPQPGLAEALLDGTLERLVAG